MTTYFEYYAGRRARFEPKAADTLEFPDITVTEGDLTPTELAQIEDLRAKMKRINDDEALMESLEQSDQEVVLWSDQWLKRW